MEIRNETVIVGLVPGAVAMVLAVLFTFIFIIAPFAAIGVGNTIWSAKETKTAKETELSPIDAQWDESQPIYRQLRDRVVAMILEGSLKEGEALPSVRQVATEYRLNPLTVLKAYQELVDEALVEKRRGLGMFCCVGAAKALMKDERQRFLETDWPKIQATIQRLGLSTDVLLAQTDTASKPPLPARTEPETWQRLLKPADWASATAASKPWPMW
jgi:GntR family transcriptional regulator